MAANTPEGLPPEFTDAMQKEPATTIGEFFASEHLIKTYLTALAMLVASVFGLAVDSELINNLSSFIFLSSPLIIAAVAKFEQWQLARQQGVVTRGAVYAPATVEKLVNGDGVVPEEDWGINRRAGEEPA